MVGENDELVAAAGADGETTHVVGVDIAYGLYPDIELLGFGCRMRWCHWFVRRCYLGGVESLLRLLDVALEIF